MNYLMCGTFAVISSLGADRVSILEMKWSLIA